MTKKKRASTFPLSGSELTPESMSHEIDLKIDEKTQDKPVFASKSAFKEVGFKATIQKLQEEIRTLYTADDVPWIIGYSGGKDSTATLQLIWTAIAELPIDQRQKKIYVISTDTLVENPIVASWVNKALSVMKNAADDQKVPFCPHRLTPSLQDSFWVNLIGRGYPAPRPKFRWCTYRLKIQPSNTFINNILSSSGKAILVLGTRKAESSARAANMTRHEKGRVHDRLSPNSTLPGSLVYTPIEDWSNDDVWFYLMQTKNPWGYNNRDLLSMYAGATEDGECPLVLDDSTPSCGDSRFGCWVCTLVEADRSMSAMILNDTEKEWMMPLLEFRNAVDFRTDERGEYSEKADRHLRDFRRMSGSVQLMANGEFIPGPYLPEVREEWLRRLLLTQKHIKSKGPSEVEDLELISLEELQEIRRIWVVDKHELEDSLPRIYREATGEEYPGQELNDYVVFGEFEMRELEAICEGDRLHYELTRDLLDIIYQQRLNSRRVGLFQQFEKTFRRNFYDDAEDAMVRSKQIYYELGVTKARKKNIADQRKYLNNSIIEAEHSYGEENE